MQQVSGETEKSQYNQVNSRSNNKPISQSFADQKQIEAFIHSNKSLKIIEEVADSYIKTYKQTKSAEDALLGILVRLHCFYEDLLHHSLELLHLVVQEPLHFFEALRFCVYSIIKNIIKQSDCGLRSINIDQIHVQLRFFGLPLQKDLLLSTFTHCYHTSLFSISGILSAYTEPLKTVLQSVWYCSTGCTRNKLQTDCTEAPLCSSCSRPMNEYSKLRTTQTYYILCLLPPSCVQTPITVNKVFRSLNVRLRGDKRMEPNQSLRAATFLGDIPNEELDAMLCINESKKLYVSSTSQISDGALTSSDNKSPTSYKNLPKKKRVSNRFLPYDGEKILDFSGDFGMSSVENATTQPSLYLSSLDSPHYKQANDSFARELECFQTQGAELPTVDFDLDELGDFEDVFTKYNNNLTPEAAQSQKVPTRKPPSTTCQTISDTCPANKQTEGQVSDDILNFVSNRNSSSFALKYAENSIAAEQSLHFSRSSIAFDHFNLCQNRSVNTELFSDKYSCVADASMVPTSVKNLYDVIKQKYSDFAFVYALAVQLCQDRVPMDCFVGLKLGLLLSVASIGCNPDCPPIPIIAVGSDANMINHLMTNVGQLAARFIGPTDDIRPPRTNMGYEKYIWFEADSNLLAKGGVFYVGDWSRLKPARAEKLFKIVECSRVPIERTTRSYPLETAVWTHWRSFKHSGRELQTFNKFVKIFGIPVYGDDEKHDVLVSFMLDQSSMQLYESTADYLSISAEDMRNFLATICLRTVDLTPEASTLLKKYFVASRVARPDCLTQKSFVVLKQLSESFAKLSFRHEVLAVDVLSAIYLYEHFMHHIYGSGDNPPPTLLSKDFIGAVDEQLDKFKLWLSNYIDGH